MSDTLMTAPTLPEPRPDDYASLLTLAQEAAAAREGQEFGMTFNGIELLNEEQSRAYMLTIRLWNALPPGVVIALIEQARALTPHPAPLGATRSMTPEEVESQKAFRRAVSRPLGATDEGTVEARLLASLGQAVAIHHADRLREAVEAFFAASDMLHAIPDEDAPAVRSALDRCIVARAALRAALQAGG